MTIVKIISIHVVVGVNRVFLYDLLLALLRTHRGVNNVLSWVPCVVCGCFAETFAAVVVGRQSITTC